MQSCAKLLEVQQWNLACEDLITLGDPVKSTAPLVAIETNLWV